MVLVDTCVWIHVLGGREPYASAVPGLLDRDEVFGHDLVYGELLIGDNGSRRKFLSEYRLIPQAPMVDHSDVVALVHLRGLHGRGLSWIDAHLLASALVSHSELWTADEALADAAKDLRVAYEP